MTIIYSIKKFYGISYTLVGLVLFFIDLFSTVWSNDTSYLDFGLDDCKSNISSIFYIMIATWSFNSMLPFFLFMIITIRRHDFNFNRTRIELYKNTKLWITFFLLLPDFACIATVISTIILIAVDSSNFSRCTSVFPTFTKLIIFNYVLCVLSIFRFIYHIKIYILGVKKFT